VWSAAGPEPAYRQQPGPELTALALEAARYASAIHLPTLVERALAVSSPFAAWAEAFPGEHYRLLAGLARSLRPRLAVEVGTFTGASALALLSEMPAEARLVTYDVIPWGQIPQTLLEAEDFAGGRLEQRVGDLGGGGYWSSQRDLFLAADLIFLDGPKDGVFEPLMLERLAALAPTARFVLVVDDIRFLDMLGPWDRFPAPKLDMTSFGHWSGTGLALVGGDAGQG
jgi:predicted O-methyltransferase YrrM